MTFTLPDLPYPHDALAPFMSREMLEHHHDKHHKLEESAIIKSGSSMAACGSATGT